MAGLRGHKYVAECVRQWWIDLWAGEQVEGGLRAGQTHFVGRLAQLRWLQSESRQGAGCLLHQPTPADQWDCLGPAGKTKPIHRVTSNMHHCSSSHASAWYIAPYDI